MGRGARVSVEASLERGFAARRLGRLREAREAFVDAVAFARDLDDGPGLVRALAGAAQVERDAGDVDSALPLLEEAVELARELDEPLRTAHTVRHLGDAYRTIGRLDEAEGCYDEVLGIYRAEPAGALEVANAVRPLALLREAQGRHDEAATFWREARRLYAEAGIAEGIEECDAALERTESPGAD